MLDDNEQKKKGETKLIYIAGEFYFYKNLKSHHALFRNVLKKFKSYDNYEINS